MADAYETGAIFTTTLPTWQRTWYEAALLETLRTKSILVPYTILKEDFQARQTGKITYTEVYDLEPNWNSINESDIWFKGGSLDSRTVSIDLAMYHDIMKFSDYNEIVEYINNGDIRGLVREKIGISMAQTLDILARNAFLAHPYKSFGVSRANRGAIASTDLFDPDLCESIRTHLEEKEVPGIAGNADGEGGSIVCVTTPRVIHDIRINATEWLDVQNYAQTGRKFNAEVGMWNGVRFVRTNRLVLKNHGAVTTQTHLDTAVAPGEGAATTVDSIYTVGQTAANHYIDVHSAVGFAVGQYITIHDKDVNGGGGNPPIETDGTQETRRIVALNVGADATHIAVDKPFLKAHEVDDLVTNGLDVHTSLFMGGPGVVYAVAERPTPILPPKMDDAMMINRVGWRGFLKFQLFRPEYFEVHECAGSTD